MLYLDKRLVVYRHDDDIPIARTHTDPPPPVVVALLLEPAVKSQKKTFRYGEGCG